MEKGWSAQKQSFVQYYGSDAIDASTLLISLTGFTAEADPRIVRTIERIQRELMYEPHVYRYSVDTAADVGLAGHEGVIKEMKAVTVFPRTKEVRVIEHEAPRMTEPDQVKLCILDIGMSGTDDASGSATEREQSR